MDQQLYKILSKILWDYTISHEAVYDLIQGRHSVCAHWDFDAVFVRMLERLSWYELLYVLGQDRIKEKLDEKIILKIYNPGLRKRYERLRKILQGEPLSFTKWGPQFSEEIQDSLFSSRWYST